MADQITGLSTSYSALSNKASRTDPAEEWTSQMLRSGVALDPQLGGCAARINPVKDEIDDALDTAISDASNSASLDLEWEAFSEDLGTAVDSCQLRPLAQGRKLAWDPTGSSVDPLEAPRNNEPLKAYLSVVDLMLQALASYYEALANAANADDLAAEEAKLKQISGAIGGLSGTAASFAAGPAGPLFGALTTAVTNLVIDLRGAYFRYQRYNAIENALVRVDDQTIEIFEDVVGTTTVLLQADQSEVIIRGPINNSISDFNVTDPTDRLASRIQLERIITRFETVRSALDPALVAGIASIGEAHKALRNDVVARDGTFENTFAQLQSLAASVDAIRDAFTDLEQALVAQEMAEQAQTE